ncbi:MAG: STAS domain-containing protein [Planctomycetota bacterium]
MKIRHDDHERTSIVTIAGEFSSDHVDQFRRVVTERTADGVRDIVFVLEEMSFIDSAGLESLLWAQDHVAESLGQVRLVQPTENVAEILHLTRLAQQFDCHQDITTAVRSLR